MIRGAHPFGRIVGILELGPASSPLRSDDAPPAERPLGSQPGFVPANTLGSASPRRQDAGDPSVSTHGSPQGRKNSMSSRSVAVSAVLSGSRRAHPEERASAGGRALKEWPTIHRKRNGRFPEGGSCGRQRQYHSLLGLASERRVGHRPEMASCTGMRIPSLPRMGIEQSRKRRAHPRCILRRLHLRRLKINQRTKGGSEHFEVVGEADSPKTPCFGVSRFPTEDGLDDVRYNRT